MGSLYQVATLGKLTVYQQVVLEEGTRRVKDLDLVIRQAPPLFCGQITISLSLSFLTWEGGSKIVPTN